jgi:ATP-binding cassette subfamily F protein 3
LGSFLFRDDDVFKKIKVLSGGEKSRVALAKTLISGANFLILDEPTNHLDIQSVNILIKALQQYEGTCIMVSHDRHFISQVANKIWYIENRALKEYPGTFDEYLHWREKKNTKPDQMTTQPKKTSVKPSISNKNKSRNSAKSELKKLQKALSDIEARIFTLEQQREDLDEQMSRPDVYADFDKLAELNTQHQKTTSTLESMNIEWEKLVEKINDLETGIE